MKKRNTFLEDGGLFWESETHEWFNDKTSTQYAQNENALGVSLKNIICFVVRDKSTGEYDRVIMDKTKDYPIYTSKSLEEIGVHIDKLKILKRFEE